MKVKICGFTRAEDVKVACDLGVDMVGAILVPKSPRCVTVEQAKELLAVASGIADRVAVIMPREVNDVKRFARELKPDYLQLHLTFPASELRKLREQLDVGLIVVAPVPRKVEDRQEVMNRALTAAEVADFILIDTKGPSGGGTGLTHEWEVSRGIREAVGKPVFLAGGLNPSNVGQAIKIVRPYGVDVATGVESSPGKKSAGLMREFIEAARRVRDE